MTKQFSINHDANVFNVLLVCVFLKILLFFASCFCFFTADDIVSRLAQYIRKRFFFVFRFLDMFHILRIYLNILVDMLHKNERDPLGRNGRISTK